MLLMTLKNFRIAKFLLRKFSYLLNDMHILRTTKCPPLASSIVCISFVTLLAAFPSSMLRGQVGIDHEATAWVGGIEYLLGLVEVRNLKYSTQQSALRWMPCVSQNKCVRLVNHSINLFYIKVCMQTDNTTFIQQITSARSWLTMVWSVALLPLPLLFHYHCSLQHCLYQELRHWCCLSYWVSLIKWKSWC